MNRDISSMLAYEAKRQPALQQILNNLSDYTEKEIEQAPFLKWIRQALLAKKRQFLTQANLPDIVDGQMPDPIGYMHRWIGAETFVRTSVSGGAIQVNPNDLIWFPLTGGVWIETVFSKAFESRLLPLTRSEGMVSKSGYIAAYKAQRERLMALVPPSVGQSQDSSLGILASYGVRFG